MLRELMNDNKALIAAMREAHEITDKGGDVATTSMLENWIDEAERRTWFLFERAVTATIPVTQRACAAPGIGLSKPHHYKCTHHQDTRRAIH